MTMRPLHVASAALLALCACNLDTDSMGGKPTLGGSTGTGGGTADADADADATADSTAAPIPEGPRRRRLDIDPAFVGTVGGATLLVVLDSSRIEYGDAQADGSDLQFYAADGVTRYPAEIEHWDPGGTSFVWVRVVDPALPDHLWMHYADGQGFDPDDSGDVWDGAFDGVWHMKAQGTAFPDASGSGNPLVAVDFMGELQADGVIGPGATITGTGGNGPLEVSDVGDLTIGDALTIEAWVSRPDDGDGHQLVAFANGAVELRAREPALSLPSVTIRTVGVGPQRVEASGTLGANWTYLAATYRADDGSLILFRNGASEATLNVPGAPEARAPNATTEPLRIGVDLMGSLDEVRVSSIARSPGWIALQHASMIDALLEYGPPIER